MPTIVKRSEWGARSPQSGFGSASMGSRTGFAVHHAAAPTSQTVKTIQNYHMDHNGWSDIGYNFLVTQDGRIWEGRQGTWTAVGAHATGYNTKWLGVCWVGNSNDVEPSDAAKRSIAWLYDEACRRAGKQLDISGHGQLPGASTSCPGSKLKKWISDGGVQSGSSGDSGSGHGSVPPSDNRDWTEELIMSLPTVKRGDKGARVRRVQGLCHAAGQRHSAIDGVFGPKTEAAVKAVQRKGAPPVDGIVGRITWTYLVKG